MKYLSMLTLGAEPVAYYLEAKMVYPNNHTYVRTLATQPFKQEYGITSTLVPGGDLADNVSHDI